MRLDLKAAKPVDPPLRLKVTGMRSDGMLHELQPQEAIAIGPRPSRVEFDFWAGEPLELGPGTFFQTRLAGVEPDWLPPQRNNRREFTGLAPGEYVFMARRIDRFGQPGPAAAYPFAVVASWYQRWPAYLGYLTLAVLITAAALGWRLRLLKRRAELLDRLITQRTRELEISKRQVELSNTAKSEFLENISHEIRNPLNGIVGLIDLLEKEGQGVPRPHARSLQECSATLVRVFDEVLNFSQLECGYVGLRERSFSLRELLEAVRALFLPLAVQRGGSVTLAVPEDLADGFWGDDAKIKTVLDNFVSNALRYAPGTQISILVSGEQLPSQTVDLLIEVADAGPGIPAEEQELIFRKFIRGARAKAAGVPGTGIGLATCQVMARLLGGSVGVESPTPAGCGSSFFLSVALPQCSPPVPVSPLSLGPGSVPGGEVSALIVDDQEYNRVVLANIARELGYRVACAANAAEAFRILALQACQIVLIDCELPGLNGPDLARQLRLLPAGGDFLLIGASASGEAAERCLAAGMDAFLVKPLSLELIREAVATAGDARRRRIGPPAPGLEFSAFRRYAESMVGGLPEAERRYREILHAEVDRLAAETERENAAGIIDAAHRLNSHASLLGRNVLSIVTWDLERAARAGRRSERPGIIALVRQAAAELERQIRAQAPATPPELGSGRELSSVSSVAPRAGTE